MSDFFKLNYIDPFAPDLEKRRQPSEGCFPKNNRMPHNYSIYTVDEVLRIDLLQDKDPLIITGYTSLLRVIKLIAGLAEDQCLRLLIGNEPFPLAKVGMTLEPLSLPEEIHSYWTTHRLSLLQYPDVFAALEKLEKRQVDAACLQIPGRMMHAKIFVTENAVILGSSNYSEAGLKRNIEANVRFKAEDEEVRYQEVKDYAEALFSLADDYRQELRQLLEALLRPSSWQDSLARACAELLEGHWAKQYLSYTGIHRQQTNLWPAQEQGIAQALWIIENLGSVLVADATGSGKTRMGAALQRAVHDKLWRTGNTRGGGIALIAPPGVAETWQRELLLYGLSHRPISQAALSFVNRADLSDLTKMTIQQAQILSVDEAHNYLNVTSKRAQALLCNLADHVLLFTATPINKSASDLLCLVNILGADNFDPDVIQGFNHWLRMDAKRMRQAREEQLNTLKQAIARFTVRRTKREFNRLIDQQPEAYRNKRGEHCRYPHHNALSYETGETTSAINLATQIRQLAEKLKGVAFISKAIEKEAFLSPNGELLSAESVLNQRVRMAKRSAIYHVMAHLRSSRVSAWAHIAGSESVKQNFEFSAKEVGSHEGMICKLQAFQPPHITFPDNTDTANIPAWLLDPSAFQQARDQEIETYQSILHLLEEMDDSRELAKLKLLDRLLADENPIGILAFDRHPLTLFWLRKLAEKHGLLKGVERLVATGESSKLERKKVNQQLDNQQRLNHNLVVFCSDAMSEGYNLQNASVVVHLDMPSVVRLVEQRIGRVDRMDSVYSAIRVYWPADHDAFALRADDLLIERFESNALLLGSNFDLPDNMTNNRVDYEEILNQAKREEVAWDGIEDAFAPIRALIGEDALLQPDHYHTVASITETGTRLSAVKSDSAWGFFCISGTEFGAPRWILFTEDSTEPLIDLSAIAQILNIKLSQQSEAENLNNEAHKVQIQNYLERLKQVEQSLLPRRKQVALQEMRLILQRWLKNAAQEEARFLEKLLELLNPETQTQRAVNWSLLAEYWLELVRPVWYEHLNTTGKRKAVLLSDLRDELTKNPLPFDQIHQRFRDIPTTNPIDERIAACIIGY